MDWIKGASGFDFENLSNIQLRPIFFFFSFYISMFSTKGKMIFFNINHIAICDNIIQLNGCVSFYI